MGSGHMRLHKHDHLSSKLEEDTPTPKRRRKKQKSKLRTMKPPEATWGNATHHNGSPRDACGEEQPDRSLSMQIQCNQMVTQLGVVNAIISPVEENLEVKVSGC